MSRNNAVLQVFAVRPRRSFLRGVMAQVYPLASRPPTVFDLVPADARELRNAGFSGDTAVLQVLAVRARRIFLRGVKAQKFPLALSPPFVAFFISGDAFELRGASAVTITAHRKLRNHAGLLLL